MARYETQFEGVLSFLEELAGVDELGFGDVDVYASEIVVQPMPDEDTSEVKEQPKLFVGDFEVHGCMP